MNTTFVSLKQYQMQQYRQLFSRKHLMMIGMPSATAAFCFWVQGNSGFPESPFISKKWSINPDRVHAVSSRSVLYSSIGGDSDEDSGNYRSFQTSADEYYKANKKIPLPSVVHTTLAELSAAANQNQVAAGNIVDANKERKNILVIGDVHGCYDELLELHAEAVKENDSAEFEYVILVGDLCNKGPHSAKVIRHVRTNQRWFSIRGNHDDAALAAALGDPNRLKRETYQWVRSAAEDGILLCDDDVHWLSELPYTILIPGDLLGEDEDTLIVHAGLIPYCDLQDQKIPTMTTIRNLLPRCDESGQFTHFEYHNGKGGESPKVLSSKAGNDAEICCNEAVSWASAWKGPQRVIFGHDAKRELQLHEGNWATGLDTGAVYGGKLTGIILPERKLISVPSKEYSPIKLKKKSV